MKDKIDTYPHYDYLTNKELTYEDDKIIFTAFDTLMQAGVSPLDIMVETWDVQHKENGSIIRELNISYKK